MYDATSLGHLYLEFLSFILSQVGWGASPHTHFQVCPEMFKQVQVWALAGPLKDIQKLVPKPLVPCFDCVLRFVVLLECVPSTQSDVLSALEQVFIKDLCVLCSFHLSFDPD